MTLEPLLALCPSPRGSAAWLLGAIVASGAAAAAPVALNNAWRIVVDGGADKQGQIVFSFSEDDVEITRISVAIPRGTPENKVARRIRKEIRRALSKADYGVDRDDGEEVVVSAMDPVKRFEIRLVSNAVTGTQISILRE